MRHLYLMTRLYNTSDKLRTCELETAILHACPDVTTYMPYRDSDEEHIQGDWKAEIFEKDIEEINKADALVGYWDGPAFDEGIGFEIGYALAKRKQIIILNDDFISYQFRDGSESLRFSDPLVRALGLTAQGQIFQAGGAETFAADLRRSATATYEAIARLVENDLSRRVFEKHRIPLHAGFVDCGGSLLIAKLLSPWATKNEFKLAQRFASPNNDPLDDVERALAAEMVYFANTGAEMSPGSAILCGLCYGTGVPFRILEDRSVTPFSMVGAQMRTNLMIDVACDGYLDPDV